MSRLKQKRASMIIGMARRILGDRVSLPHLMAFLRCNSLRKTANMVHVLWEIKRGRSRVRSKPFILFLEVNNICNLHCPFCLTGKEKNTDRPRRNMTLSEMIKTIEEVSRYLYFIQLYNWGEPLLNKDLFDFINYVHQRRIFTMVSSNMNFVKSETAERIVTSGLDYFIAAIDGFSARSYAEYRRGGNFENVINNLKEVLSLRKKAGKSWPFVEWQYVVFKHNQHEIEGARRFAHGIGVDYFHPIPGYIEDPEWIATLPEYQVDLGRHESVARCRRLWTHLNVRCDGGVAACCYEFYKKDDFGNILQTPFSQLWNNPMFTTARDVLLRGVDEAPETPLTICHRCVASGMRPSFEEVK
jgi:MoaA/NifB/PqqE/SkfB family radical SAM enzyme